jgi:glycosyltransferase involved in cell wall biosynthesis
VKVLVFAHRLEVGGTQQNAIELTATLRDRHGFEPVLFAEPGPAAQLVDEHRLRVIRAPAAGVHPSPARGRALRAVVREERPDLVHVWDWPQCLDAYYAVHMQWRTPILCTVMSMVVPRLIPLRLHTTFGTPDLVKQAQAAGRPDVDLLLPPVDVRANAPEGALPADSAAAFRSAWAVRDDDVLLVIVGRLVSWMKLEGLRRSIEAVRVLGRELPLRLAIVGDGTARHEVAAHASRVNAELGREAVVLTGEQVDPRPAYAAADIVLGMGGSSLRGLAFGKPLIVLGEHGFSKPFTAATAPWFLEHGMYGLGPGVDPAADPLAEQLRDIATQPDRWAESGAFGREFVLGHFALDVVSDRLAECCQRVAGRRASRGGVAVDAVRTGAMNALRLARSAPPPAAWRPGRGAGTASAAG